MQAVFGFVEHDRLRAVEDFVGHLLAAMGRKAVHENRIRRGVAHQLGINLERLEYIVAAGTVFLVLADQLTPDLITIASRCVRVDLGPVPDAAVAERLVAEGVDPERAREAAAVAVGDLGRARLLAGDERLALRRAAWHAVPDRLDGTGASAVIVADELLAMILDAMAPILAAHEAELAELEERVKPTGERGSGRTLMVDRHKREARRYRTDEVRAGLTELARRYRDEMTDAVDPTRAIAAIEAIASLAEELIRNPNERLQLVALFVRLGRVAAR